MKKFIKIFDGVFSLLCAVIFTFVFIGDKTLPDNIISYNSEVNDFSSFYSFVDNEKTQSVDYQGVSAQKTTLKLLGAIPVKDVGITDKPSGTVFVSGEAFGIKLYTDGVIVVGTKDVELDDKTVNPAKEAGICVGDVIISINGINVYSSDDVIDAINNNNGLDYRIKVKRDGRYKNFTLKPVYSNKEGCYKAGIWVRDSTAGIGTVTFYNKQSGMFAALGHQINDVDTNEIIPLLEGEAVGATVTGVQSGNKNAAGSLCCRFEDYTVGRLMENTSCGIYGSYTSVSDKTKEYTVAAAQEVKKGSAQIISTVDGNSPQTYDIEIVKVNYKGDCEKDIVFKVKDDKLIEKTGGIVQGMSGSPIIQNNKLVGAVTHVIVDNPKKGYGIFAQTMYEKSNNVK